MKNCKKPVYFIVFIFIMSTLLSSCSVNESIPANSTAINANERLIKETRILETIKELSSDKYKGRLAGTEENEKAAQYLAQCFEKVKLESPEGLDNYIQKYTTKVQIIKNEPVLQLEDKDGKVIKKFKYTENFVIRALSNKTRDIDIKAPLFKVESLEAMDELKDSMDGKIVLFPISSIKDKTTGELVSLLYRHNVLAGIGEFDTKSKYRKYSSIPITPLCGPWVMGGYKPYLFADNDTYKELSEAADKNLFLRFICSFEQDFKRPVSNVIGLIEGSDPKLKDEYIIIGSHFDHLGDNMNGTYNPGALDNASGTAGLLEIARIVKSNKIQPKKSILFIAFNGEEYGMKGSKHYVNNPIYPLDKAVMINMDMIGAAENMPLTIAIKDYSGFELQSELYKYAKELNIEAKRGESSGSDHASFASEGVASVMLIDRDFENGYHSPNDNMEDISKSKIEQVVKLVLHYIDKNAY